MYCPRCGTENADNAQVCSSCSPDLSKTSGTDKIPNTKISRLAIASLVLAILSPFTCLVTWIPAIILGIVSLVIIKKSPGRLKGKGLAIAGIAVAVALLLPALARTRRIAFRMDCGTNMSGLGTAMLIYDNDYDKFPTCSKWCDLLIECSDYAKPSKFRCKGATEGPCNYAINKNVEGLGRSDLPDVVLLFETHPGWNQSGGPEILTTDNHQGDGCNVMFTNFHTYFVKAKDLDSLRWKP